jgi:hypothetical protein
VRLWVPNHYSWANLTDAELLNAMRHLEQTPFVVRIIKALESLADHKEVVGGLRQKLEQADVVQRDRRTRVSIPIDADSYLDPFDC